MPSVSNPFGLVPVGHQSGYGTRGARAYQNALPTGYANAIYENQPIQLLTTGYIQEVQSNAVDFLGSFVGVEWTDSTGRFRVSNTWPAAQAGTNITCYVNDDPYLIYEIQLDGQLSATLATANAAVGDQTSFTNLSSGSTTTGISAATSSSTLAGAGVQGQLRIIGFSLRPDNAPTDAYPIVQVMIARHQYVAVKVAI
jgi:hypothetical protein